MVIFYDIIIVNVSKKNMLLSCFKLRDWFKYVLNIICMISNLINIKIKVFECFK